MHSSPSTLDGYRLIRPIGRGGFGEVWLCQSETLGDFRALKILSSQEPGRLEREFEALCQFRAAANRLKTPSLLSIEHVNRHADSLFYVMPLCDGVDGRDPSDSQWRPLTLSALLEQRRLAPKWFSPSEICEIVGPLLQALQLLANAGLVHRDVKPDNILFVDGRACLADIGLLGNDAAELTRRGTPGYAAPSWYLESGGHPDMYGAAATLYVMLTGNTPDKIGRSAFRWPPQGEESLDLSQRDEFLRLHQIIRRAMDERVAERFVDFEAFERALRSQAPARSAVPQSTFKTRVLGWIVIPLAASVALSKFGAQLLAPSSNSRQASVAEPPEASLQSSENTPQKPVPEAFLQALQQTRTKWVPSRDSIRMQIDGVIADLNEIVNNRPTELTTVTQRLSEIDARLKAIVSQLPAQPDITARRESLEQLRATAFQASRFCDSAQREHMDRQIRDLEWEFSTEGEFRMEQAKRFMPLAIQIVNAYQPLSVSPKATSAMILIEEARERSSGSASKRAVREWAASIYKTGQKWAFAL